MISGYLGARDDPGPPCEDSSLGWYRVSDRKGLSGTQGVLTVVRGRTFEVQSCRHPNSGGSCDDLGVPERGERSSRGGLFWHTSIVCRGTRSVGKGHGTLKTGRPIPRGVQGEGDGVGREDPLLLVWYPRLRSESSVCREEGRGSGAGDDPYRSVGR